MRRAAVTACLLRAAAFAPRTARPRAARAMASLDRAALADATEVAALVLPAKRTGEFLKRLRPHLLEIPRQRSVASTDDAATKKVLLATTLPTDAEALAAALPPDAAAFLRDAFTEGVKATTHVVARGYDDLTVEEALKKVLPSDVPAPTAFEACGHVAHLNLRPEHEPWKRVVAEIMLDKLKGIRTVVNKVGEIDSLYRTYELEVLGGDSDTTVELREQDCVFRFDVRDVYWNSRLQSEHGRLIETIPRESRVADCTAGVGPFSVPLAARRGVACRANDLNPRAVDALRANALANRCGDRLVAHDAGCARQFLRDLAEQGWRFTHAIYNLPASGIELLDAFRGLDLSEWDEPPLVHCYCFAGASRGAHAAQKPAVLADVRARCEAALGAALPPGPDILPSPEAERATALAADGQFIVRWVRNVSPNKDMYCASFRVPVSGKRARVG